MSNKTAIEWTNATWSPVTGCTPISPGCKNCYAKRFAEGRLRHLPKYRNGFKPMVHEKEFAIPRRWKKPRRVFVCSMGGLFHEKIAPDHVERVLNVISFNPQHTFQILTKRADRMADALQKFYQAKGIENSIPNLWLGVTAENQATADERIPPLLQTPAVVRFVSVEPMLGPVVLSAWPILDWVICGGETGPGARWMDPDWVLSLQDQCASSGVPFFFKGWGAAIMRKTNPAYRTINNKMFEEYPEVKK